jgi:hypothetical protein
VSAALTFGRTIGRLQEIQPSIRRAFLLGEARRAAAAVAVRSGLAIDATGLALAGAGLSPQADIQQYGPALPYWTLARRIALGRPLPVDDDDPAGERSVHLAREIAAQARLLATISDTAHLLDRMSQRDTPHLAWLALPAAIAAQATHPHAHAPPLVPLIVQPHAPGQLEQTVLDADRRLDQLITRRQRLCHRLFEIARATPPARPNRSVPPLLALWDVLYGLGALTAHHVADLLGGRRHPQALLKTLVRCGEAREATGRQSFRVWVPPDILARATAKAARAPASSLQRDSGVPESSLGTPTQRDSGVPESSLEVAAIERTQPPPVPDYNIDMLMRELDETSRRAAAATHAASSKISHSQNTMPLATFCRRVGRGEQKRESAHRDGAARY